jgi:NAD(P)-dependent dehydrogenase (short-subunit alcohol dehydrogenase family)
MKAALNSLSRSLALELAPRGVRVNVVSPGPVLTEMQAGAGGVAEHVVQATGGSIEDYVASVEEADHYDDLPSPRRLRRWSLRSSHPDMDTSRVQTSQSTVQCRKARPGG